MRDTLNNKIYFISQLLHRHHREHRKILAIRHRVAPTRDVDQLMVAPYVSVSKITSVTLTSPAGRNAYRTRNVHGIRLVYRTAVRILVQAFAGTMPNAV